MPASTSQMLYYLTGVKKRVTSGSEISRRLIKACSPARFVMVKKGRVSNPVEVLDPKARRSSLYFDELLPIEDDEFEDEHKPEDIKIDAHAILSG